MVHQATLAVRGVLPVLRVAERPGRMPAQDHAVPLPREGLRSQAVQRPDGHGHGMLEDRLPGLDAGDVPGHDEPQGRFVHEAAP